MNIIKCDAITSTNDYLKELQRILPLKNFIVVWAMEQTKGKGQRGNSWQSEKGKNLTFSILHQQKKIATTSIFDLNVAVSVSLRDALSELTTKPILIKWPNDIMADGKKIAGILIENSIKNESNFSSIIGIGCNINQVNFLNLPNTTSLKLLEGEDYCLEDVLAMIMKHLKKNINKLESNVDVLWKKYDKYLFKKNETTLLEVNQKQFEGKITKVTKQGLLEVLHLHESKKYYYDVKEIKWIY